MMDLRVFVVVGLFICHQQAVGVTSLRHRRATVFSLSTSSFGASLYKRLASGNHDNIIFSPFSVYTALTMTLLGAGGDTERQLKTALEVQEGQNIHAGIHNLLTSITGHDSASNVTLRVADAVYYDAQQVHVTDSFASNMGQYYGAGMKPFQRPNPEQAINTWVEEVTEGVITNFLQPGAITADTVLMLLNAVFFEASWQTMFEPTSSRHIGFTTLSGAVKQVSTMYKEDRFSVKNVPELDARVLELPYRGGHYSFFILLPMTKNGLPHLEGLLNGQSVENVVRVMPSPTELAVFLPKFTMRVRKGLKEPLQALGLKNMFDTTANFTLIARATGGRNILVSDVQHEAMIEVTESGTKAAAVTSVGFQAESVPQTFGVDHPFIFILRDKVDGLNLFMGRLADPTQGEAATQLVVNEVDIVTGNLPVNSAGAFELV